VSEEKMPTELAVRFRAELQSMHASLLTVPGKLADIPWREGGWTRKEILGHLMDSAANNRQRFVRAATEGSYAGPSYLQQAWVDAHGYKRQSWPTLLGWWETEQQILAAVVENIPADRLDVRCTVGENAPVSLRFLIEDYLAHHREHVAQILSGATSA
jgi:hypothetical protein